MRSVPAIRGPAHSRGARDRSSVAAGRIEPPGSRPASLLAFGVIAWEHIFHSMILGVTAEHGGHVEHVFRDALLAFPMATVAVAAGLRIGRRVGLM